MNLRKRAFIGVEDALFFRDDLRNDSRDLVSHPVHLLSDLVGCRAFSEMNAGRADDIAGGQLQTVPFQELIEFSLDQSRMIRTAQY